MVPKDRTDPLSQRCVTALDRCMISFVECDAFVPSDTQVTTLATPISNSKSFNKMMTDDFKPFWCGIINMYENTLSSPEALMQVRKLLSSLAELYVTAYDGIFQTQVEHGDPEGLQAFNEKMQEMYKRSPNLMTGGEGFGQETFDIQTLYAHTTAVSPDYTRLCMDIVLKTNGEFAPVPLKHLFRAIEKTQ